MTSVYRIGDLVLDTGRQELRRGAEPIHLGPLSYRLLLALVEAAPNVVSHDALANAVWDGRPVSPETISQRAKLLREAIGDDAHHPRYVELLRGRGYRLIPPVAQAVAETATRPPGLRAMGIGALLTFAAAALIWWQFGPEPAPPPSPSIAVLPFANMSPGQDQEYFADGIAEEILNLLSRMTPLKVIARTSSFSFKGKNADIPTIAAKLDVSYVLQGSVRRSENHVRVAVQLVAGADGTHLWSESYDRELRDILQLQNEIATSVAAALEVNLFGRGPSIGPAKPVKPEAFDAFLRGRQLMQVISVEGLAEAERNFKRAIEIEPTFVRAYSSLGLVYGLQITDVQVPLTETINKLRGIVQQGLAIAPDDPGLIGHSGELARYDGNMRLAEQRLRRAFELDPADVTIVVNYAAFKLDQGHPKEALEIVQRLLERDPLNPLLYITMLVCHLDLGNGAGVAAAAKRYNDATAVPTGNGFNLRGVAKLLMGDLVGGIRDLARGADIRTGGATRPYGYPELYYVLGDVETGDAALKVYVEVFDERTDFDYAFTLVYRHLVTGEVDRAREMALEAFSAREDYSAAYSDILLAYLATDALIASGEAERVVELIERMAPVYATYRATPDIPPEEFSPAPYPVKGTQTSYPASYFPLYIRALRAAGDAVGADNMLGHLEAILQLRRERGLFTSERHVAEARALRGDLEGALDALEQAARDGTLYLWWHIYLLHNEIFADIRDHPRFEALIARVEDEMGRQRADLEGTFSGK
jgi:TolB-like protein/DNA-binding winged helix-turn-helix (wHTH) protein/Tfp pilus assembly protein PilF